MRKLLMGLVWWFVIWMVLAAVRGLWRVAKLFLFILLAGLAAQMLTAFLYGVLLQMRPDSFCHHFVHCCRCRARATSLAACLRMGEMCAVVGSCPSASVIA
jgi:hypothetical protein